MAIIDLVLRFVCSFYLQAVKASLTMSFKRDGDDTALLRDLQKRRINHLLIDHIPEDEAKLLSNGRYTCTICSYRPVFDTVETLYSHRRGKKHQHYFTQHLAKLKDKQQQDMSKNKPDENHIKKNIKTSLGSGNSLHKQKAYSSCRRKPTLDLTTSTSTTQNTSQDKSSSASKAAHKVVQTYLKNVQKKKSFEDVVKKSKKTYPKVSTPSPQLTTMEPVIPSSTITSFATIHQPEDQDKKARQAYYSKLRQSGWKKDWNTGQWVKDEDAEFDSDEEPPDDSHLI